MNELEELRYRLTKLRLENEYLKLTVHQLLRECRTYQQIAIAAQEKARILEERHEH